MSADAGADGAPVREPNDISPTEVDRGLSSGQLDRLARGVTERLLVDKVTPETDETSLVHIYSERGTCYTVDTESSACTCLDYQHRRPAGEVGDDWRCKYGMRAEIECGRRGLPSWSQLDAVDPLLLERFGLDDTETDR